MDSYNAERNAPHEEQDFFFENFHQEHIAFGMMLLAPPIPRTNGSTVESFSSNPLESQLQTIQKDLEALQLQTSQTFGKPEEKFQESGCQEIHELLEKKEDEMDSLHCEFEDFPSSEYPMDVLLILQIKTEKLSQDLLELQSKLDLEPLSGLKRHLETNLKEDIEVCEGLKRDIDYNLGLEATGVQDNTVEKEVIQDLQNSLNLEKKAEEDLEAQFQALEESLDQETQAKERFMDQTYKLANEAARILVDKLDVQENLYLERQAKEALEAQVKELQKSLDQERQAKEALQKSLEQKTRPAGLDKLGQVLLRTLNLETQAKAASEAQVQSLQNSLTQETEYFKEEIQKLQECIDEEREDHHQSKVCLQKCLGDIRVLNKIIDAKDYDFSVKIKNLQKTLDSESDVRKEMEEDMEDLKMIIATMNLNFDAEREMTSRQIQNYQMTIEDVHQELETLKEQNTQLDDDVTAKSEEIMELNKKLADFEVDIHHMYLLLKERNDEKKALSDDVNRKTAHIQELIGVITTLYAERF